MTRQELLDRANAHFEARGWTPITDRQLNDWRDEDLIEGPSAKGRRRGLSPEWDWPNEALETAKEIGRLKSLEATRSHQLRCYLWISGRPIATTKVRESLQLEFARMVNKERRRLGDTDTRGKDSRRQARLNRAGTPDADLPTLSTEDLGEAQLKALDDTLNGDNSTSSIVLQALMLAAEKVFPDMKGFFAGMPGLLGLPDETDASALASLKDATDEELHQARAEVVNIRGKIRWAAQTGIFAATSSRPSALREKLLNLDNATWAIGFFAQSLNGIRRLRSKKVGAKRDYSV